MTISQILKAGTIVPKQQRVASLQNHINYLELIANKCISLQEYSQVRKQINLLKAKLNPKTKIMEREVKYEQVVIDDATLDNEMYYLDVVKEKKVLEKDTIAVYPNNTKDKSINEYLNSLFEGVTV